MLTAEIKINGCLLSHVYIHNTGVEPGMGDCYNYEYEVYNVGEGESKGVIWGFLKHKRSDGALELVKKVLGKCKKKDK